MKNQGSQRDIVSESYKKRLTELAGILQEAEAVESEFNSFGDFKIKDMELYLNGVNIGDAHITLSTPSASESQPYLKLWSIRLLNTPKGQGVGTEFMKQLLKLADAKNYIITLTPSEINKSRLERWYKSLGFIFNKGKNKDFLHRDLMHRLPK